MMILAGLVLNPELADNGRHDGSIRSAGFPYAVRANTPALHFGSSLLEGRKPSDISRNETKEVILRKALESLREEFNPAEYRFSLKPRWIPGSLLKVDAESIVSVVREGSVERYTNFEVTFQENNQYQKSQIQLAVNPERKLPVASRRILNGEVIKPDDLDLQWVSVPYDRGQLVSDEAVLEGKTLRRTLAAGQPVRHADVGREYLIEAGDEVQLIFEEKGIRIEITGVARQSGVQYDEINIYSDETRRRYLGRIIGPGVATWKSTL